MKCLGAFLSQADQMSNKKLAEPYYGSTYLISTSKEEWVLLSLFQLEAATIARMLFGNK